MDKNSKIFYCDVDPNYLNELFGKELANKMKLTTVNRRPLLAIYVSESKLLVIPENSYIIFSEKTYHGKDKENFGKYNFNFNCDETKYLDIGSYFFAPVDSVTFPSIYNFAFQDEKIKEVKQRFNVLKRLIWRFNDRMSINQTFKDAHPFVEQSKRLTKEKNKIKGKGINYE